MRYALRTFLFLLLIPAIAFALIPRLAITTASAADASPESQIRTLIEAQADAWNRGDIDSFMTSYWKSDQTAFVGAKGLTRGYEAVLERYRKVYPDRQSMGHLTFSDLEIHVLCPDTAFAIGQFHLQREKDNPEGIFTLTCKKLPEGWRVILDHSTAFAPPTH
ncbi:MAG: nuclear transport factor 2 family protein [Candidatus Acidiferrales bacterium]